MTYKYLYVRREMYEKKPANVLNTYRSLSDMRQLFRLPYWIMLGVLLASIIAVPLILIINFTSPFVYIPFAVIVLISIFSQVQREKCFYNDLARENELYEKSKNYEMYISDVKDVLHKFGIDGHEKLSVLREECEAMLKSHKDRFGKLDSKIIDMFVGVPLGALIASIIYANGKAVSMSVLIVIVIGFALLGLAKLIKSIGYYSEGYFKDKYLLDAIDEMVYCEKI